MKSVCFPVLSRVRHLEATHLCSCRLFTGRLLCLSAISLKESRVLVVDEDCWWEERVETWSNGRVRLGPAKDPEPHFPTFTDTLCSGGP